MDDRQNQPMENNPGAGAESDPRSPRSGMGQTTDDLNNMPPDNYGWKGGQAGGSDINAGDTSDYGTDSMVETQEVIGVGSANEDFNEAGGDATDDIIEGLDEEEDE